MDKGKTLNRGGKSASYSPDTASENPLRHSHFTSGQRKAGDLRPDVLPSQESADPELEGRESLGSHLLVPQENKYRSKEQDAMACT